MSYKSIIKAERKSKYICTFCGSKMHPTAYCTKTWDGQVNRKNLRCSYCGQKDHNYDACEKKAGIGKNPIILKD